MRTGTNRLPPRTYGRDVRRRTALALTAALFGSAALVIPNLAGADGASPWPMYAHDGSHTGATSAFAPSSEPPPLWSFPLEGLSQENASPVVGADGTIYVPTDVALFAVRPEGTLKWRKWGEDAFDRTGTWNAPAIGPDGTVYVWKEASPMDEHWPGGALFALDPASGATLWSSEIGRASYGSPTVGADGVIYIGTASSEGPSKMYAINPNGTVRWDWESSTDSDCWIESSAALGSSGRVYLNHNCSGLVALDASGSELWSKPALGDEWNSPSVGPDGTVYIGNSDYYFYAVNPDGTRRWRVAVENWMYDDSASISPDGSTIYRGDNGGIFYAFRSSGTIKWKFRGAEGQVGGAAAVTGNGVVFFPSGGSIYALRSSDGQLLWKRSLGSPVQPPAVGANGTLYVVAAGASGDSTLHAFGCGTDLDGDGIGESCKDVNEPDDTTPPETTITRGPSGRTTDRTPSFRFKSNEVGSTFKCRLDDRRWVRCSSPKGYGPLTYGRHVFRVRAHDAANNVDPTPAVRRFRIVRR
jgi:outer membrane protein assembly factor BamB